jgi:probable HAF family extracellular repeat protein
VALDISAGQYSRAQAINKNGQIVGRSGSTAALWDETAVTDLGATLTNYSEAYAINDSGQAVGYGEYSHAIPHAILWNGTTPTILNPPGYLLGTAYGINNSGQIVGVVGQSFHMDVDPSIHATIWNGTTATFLDTLGGTHGSAHAINELGKVVGSSDLAGNTTRHATLWNGTTPTDLGTLSGEYSHGSHATAINNTGRVVGYSYGSSRWPSRATVWSGTIAEDLNEFLSWSAVNAGWTLNSATGINDSGWIVGEASNALTGESHAYLLTPLADKEQCKNSGWQNFDFSNEGQCIQFVITGK